MTSFVRLSIKTLYFQPDLRIKLDSKRKEDAAENLGTITKKWVVAEAARTKIEIRALVVAIEEITGKGEENSVEFYKQLEKNNN
jgi:hypothetical protein